MLVAFMRTAARCRCLRASGCGRVRLRFAADRSGKNAQPAFRSGGQWSRAKTRYRAWFDVALGAVTCVRHSSSKPIRGALDQQASARLVRIRCWPSICKFESNGSSAWRSNALWSRPALTTQGAQGAFRGLAVQAASWSCLSTSSASLQTLEGEQQSVQVRFIGSAGVSSRRRSCRRHRGRPRHSSPSGA
jgi:hypothetical protein